jgi:antitoxin component YwqK of YwqJK toxin-antitoxin module
MKNGKTKKHFIMHYREGQEPHNKQGKRHGLWILYWADNSLCSKTNYVNGDRVGLREHKARFSNVIKKNYYAR